MSCSRIVIAHNPSISGMDGHTCPDCDALIYLDQSNSEVGTVEAGQYIRVRGRCDECGARMSIWAEIDSVE